MARAPSPARLSVSVNGRGRGARDHTKIMADTSDRGIYILGGVLGIVAGVLDVKVGDLLLTALFVLVATMLLGALRPQRPWRWTLTVAAFVPTGATRRVCSADRKTVSRADLRIVSRLPDRHCRRVRWSDSTKRIEGIVGSEERSLSGTIS